MPVFFYIDPDFLDDPFLENTNEITLSYTFFESKPGMKLPTYNPGELELCIWILILENHDYILTYVGEVLKGVGGN